MSVHCVLCCHRGCASVGSAIMLMIVVLAAILHASSANTFELASSAAEIHDYDAVRFHSNQMTGLHSNQHTGHHDNQHTGLHDNQHTGHHDNQRTGHHDNQHTGLHDNQHTGLHDNQHTGLHGNRTKRQLSRLVRMLAVPAGALISIAPRFGWLLYQGVEDDEELDFVLQSEFIYRFPEKEEEEEDKEDHRSEEELEQSENEIEEEKMRTRDEHQEYHQHYPQYNQQQQQQYNDNMANFQLNFDHNMKLVRSKRPRRNIINNNNNNNNINNIHKKKVKKSSYKSSQTIMRRMTTDKLMMYKLFENALNLMGVNGRQCLLRSVCQISAQSLAYDGVVGEIINLILRPRHMGANDSRIPVELLQAEQHGLQWSSHVSLQHSSSTSSPPANCSVQYPDCRLDMFNHVHLL